MMNFNKSITISTSSHTMLRQLVVLIFVVASIGLFFYLNKVQPHYYIDEIFHVPQTLRFCNRNFFEWDQKITTLPGLYLMAVVLFAPLKLCNTIVLRGINLIGTFANFFVVYQILTSSIERRQYGAKQKSHDQRQQWTILIASLNIAILPPLYFLLFLYYTDVISTNLVLLMYLFYIKRRFKTSAFAGVLAVLFRQTNIVWVAWICLELGMDILEKKNPNRIHKSFKNTPAYVKLLWDNAKEEILGGRFTNLAAEIFGVLLPYLLIGLSFAIFILWNKGIVLGDRSAHVATFHVPQIFYCSVFFAFFAWPYFISHVIDFLRFAKARWGLTTLALLLVGIIVRYNTLVHPYLLADNRHYTFYVWNKTIGRYYLARYLFVPIYGFCLFATWRALRHLRFLSQIGYFIATFIVLVPQLLLEPRYFFIPYIIYRINSIDSVKPWQLFAESLTTLLVNAFQFYVFSTKVFYWDDDEYPQRISW
ncbi:dol-P-Glc:Glc(2)Man(9)GlcNAc(2)-PP-Dol alpha-1,2-glucosyltransferase isoform X1 [Neodiprion pinetum]|uniref:dol-P-Glc:Glc(2)Man(9)GlcNAc(2)-PP-Dol alpha-1,2-glucosyltransferase isoform X1 n=2 Tax=Neodiprion pinetum TaxID=441929 RepID=UPI001EDEE33A|nr:putative Dol-P-Glc:Glc(2)Man(9)GlcNAc(2)-PP-Dol alpha-1,2-glucosyltransferase isoform X1 [Neodiprion pinetum]